jgi:3-dehydroquinate dehydratase I
MPSPDICGCIVSVDDLALALEVREQLALYEVRIDLIGPEWPRVAAALRRPWIACYRIAAQGGRYDGDEGARLDVLRRAVGLGAAMVDIELTAPDAGAFVREMRGRARMLVSHHDFEGTSAEGVLVETVRRQQELGADVCKVVTTARSAEDMATVLQVPARCRPAQVVAFAMGPAGMASRVLAPLAGSPFTYASLARGSESAPGQLTVQSLRAIYDAIGAR